LPPTRA